MAKQSAPRQIYFQHMTKTGYMEIEQQIRDLQKERPAKIKALKAARALGDLSENTEYSTAKRELRHLESRMRYLNKQLTYAKIITTKDDGKVDMGKAVTIQFTDDSETATYIIVGKHEADIASGKIAFDSPLGKALMHHQVNDLVTVAAPAGAYHVKIKAVKVQE